MRLWPARLEYRGVAVVLFAAAIIVWLLRAELHETAWGHARSEQQVRGFVAALAVGQSREEVSGVFQGYPHDKLKLTRFNGSTWYVETPTVLGGANWLVVLAFSDAALQGVAVRSADNIHVRPADAPGDRGVLP